tara:strand:+ start:195 stop:458 length:264 start_codon:yes stop_codon:yes gene_type:complete
MSHIEYTNQGSVFTAAQIRSKVSESRAYWKSPAGKRKAAQLEAEKRNRKRVPAKFPELAGRKPITRATDSSSASIANLKKRIDILSK